MPRDGGCDFSLYPAVSLVVGLDAEILVLRDDRRAGYWTRRRLQTFAWTHDTERSRGMKRGSLFAAAAIVLIANGFALAHSWRDRSGPVDADIVLTERELPQAFDTDDENSGVALNFSWDDGRLLGTGGTEIPWLDA